MAGAGYKLFNTGDVLTAAQVNTYLNEQTVMVFASAAARTTALTSVLAEGMMSYLQDTNSVEVYNGSSWVNVGNAGDITEVQAGTGISVASGTGPVPVITNTVATAFDAAGDLVYGTGADTFTKLSLGTAGKVLTVNSGATAPEWATPAGGGANFTLVNAGGTALTGATTVTVSGISGKDKILVLIAEASSANASALITVRVNADSGNNYYRFTSFVTRRTTYAAADGGGAYGAIDGIRLGTLSTNAGSQMTGGILLTGCNSSGVKIYQGSSSATAATGVDFDQVNNIGYYDSSSTISSVSIVSSSGNLDNGTVYVYASA